MITSSEKTEETPPNEVIPLEAGQPKWEKEDKEWVWRSHFCVMKAKVVNENSYREFLIDIRHQYDRHVSAIALIPKEVMEDLYKEFTQYDMKEQELLEMRAELKTITEQLEKTRADLIAAMAQLESVPTETDDDEDYNG